MAAVSTVRERASRNGSSRTAPGAVAPPEPQRRRRLPELAVGVVLVVVGALVGLWWFGSTTERVEVLTVARDVARGEVVTDGDLAVVDVAAGDAVTWVPAGRLEGLAGRVAAVGLVAGDPVTESMLAPGAAVPEGMRVVGVTLEPGAYPLGDLDSGDRVDVVVVADDTEPVVAASGVEVFRVQALAGGERLLVSLLVPAGETVPVAAAAGAGSVRLVSGG